MGEEVGWRARLRRWRWYLAIAVLLLVVRVALPAVLRRVIISQAAQNLRAEIELGNVDLHLYRGGIVLEDFALRPLAAGGAKPQGDVSGHSPAEVDSPAPPDTRTPLAAPAAGLEVERPPPIVAWKKLALGLSFRPLWHKTIQLYEVELEAPQIALDRLATGDLNVMTVLPEPAAQTAAPSPTLPHGGEAASPGATMPPGGPERAAAASAAPDDAWRFGIDHLAIGTGRLIFRDLMLPDSEPIEVGIPTIDVHDIALDSRVYGDPTSSRLKILVDEGFLELSARVRLADDKTTLEAEAEAQGLPLRRSRLYIPDVGWSDLRGLLDMSLRYKLETGVRNELRGTVTLRDVAVTVPRLPEAALAWQRLSVRVDPIDLLAHSATVEEVDLAGAVLTVEPRGGDTLPVMARRHAAAAASEPPPPSPATALATPETTHGEPAAEKAETKPWRWSLASLRLSDSLVRLLRDSDPFDIGVDLAVKRLSDAGEEPAAVDLRLQASGGSIAVQGNTRIVPPGFGGTVVVRDLSLPELIDASGAVPDSPLLAARLGADIRVSAGIAAPMAAAAAAAGPTDLRLGGTISLSDMRLAPPGMKDAEVAIKTIDLTLSQLDLPGALALDGASPPSAGKGDVRFQGELALAEPRLVLPGGQQLVAGAKALRVALPSLELTGLLAPSAGKGDVRLRGEVSLSEANVVLGDGKEFVVGAKEIRVALANLELPGVLAPPAAAARPLVAALSEVRLDAPVVKLTRTATGLVLPGAGGAAPAEEKSGGQASGAAQAGPPSSSPAPGGDQSGTTATGAAGPSGAAPVQFGLATFQLSNGRIDVVDRSVKPTFSGGLSAVNIQARDIRWPDLAARQVHLTTNTPGSGEIEIKGDLSSRGGEIQFDVRQMDLPALNSYAATYSPFSIRSGDATVTTKVSFSGENYDVGNSITLHDFDLSGKEGESLFEQNFGVPLSTALALLRDAQGNIAMDIPVKVGREGTQLDILGIASQAMRIALVNALTSPLRLLGAVTGSGDKVASIAPAAISFRPGRADPDAAAEKRLEQLGAFLASRPALAVELGTGATRSDAQWMREQDLRHSWAEQGLLASLLALVEGDTRDRIQAALDDRAKDEPGKLSEEDSRVLEQWLAERPPVSPEQLRALAEARLVRTQTALIGIPGVAAARIIALPPDAELGDGPPEVQVKLKSALASSPEP